MPNSRHPAGAGAPVSEACAQGHALGMTYQIRLSPDGRQRRFTYVASNCAAMNGVTADAAMADPAALYDLVTPEFRPALEAAEAQALAARAPFEIELAMRRADGVLRWRKLAASPHPQADGSVLWDGMMVDITDRKRLEQELQEQRRRLELAVEATSLGLWDWDLDTGQFNASDLTREIMGLGSDAEFSLKDFFDAIHPEDRPRVDVAYETVLKMPDGGDFAVEYRVFTADGGLRWVLTRGRVLRERQGPSLAVGSTMDVTARKASEDQRALIMGELAHRAKNGLAVLAAIVSQSARTAADVPDLEKALVARLNAMARSQDLVTTAADGRRPPLLEVLRSAFEPFGLPRFELDPALAELEVTPEMAVGVALLVHELATNALKHGALSRPEGRVHVRRVAMENGSARLLWRECGGPPVQEPKTQGFGSRLLRFALRQQGGQVEGRFELDGFQADIELRLPDPAATPLVPRWESLI